MDTWKLICAIEKQDLHDIAILTDYFDACRILYLETNDRRLAKPVAEKLMRLCDICDRRISETVGQDNELCGKFYELKKAVCKFLAYDYFEYFLLYVEWDRPAQKKFYPPRRKVLKRPVDALQRLEERQILFLGISLPPRVGKSTLCVFFMTWVMGRHPESASVASGFSDKLTESFYKELLSIIGDADTYHYAEVFPNAPLVNTSAKNESIDLGKEKRFPTITCRSVVGTLTGAVEIGENGILYCDDLVEDLAESLSPDRLDTKYNAYLNQLKDRKKDGAAELMVGTRWNLLDPLGRIQEQYRDDPRYEFIVIPALDKNDESNFDYKYGVGFSTEYYHDMRRSIDDNTWWAKYMGQPYARQGLLFHSDKLNYYNGILPDCPPDRIVAACDVAWGGGDFLSMPICYFYGDTCYVADVVFNNGDKTVTRPLVVGRIMRHLPHVCQFEANNGGHEYAAAVDKALREKKIMLNITSRRAPSNVAKIARIIQHAPDISRMVFLDAEHQSQEYREFMRWLCMFVTSGKNEHDDAPDSLAMVVEAVSHNFGEVTVGKRVI